MDTNKDAIQIDWEKKVDEKFEELLSVYTSSRHRKKVDIIAKAFNFARQAHKGVRRLSGEPYIMHPIAVALIACKEIGLGSTSICAALLHDVVEDTDYTTEDIENMFGPKIAQIVEGLTKISGGIFGDKASAQAENFKKLLLTMSDDIRVVLIKICDRLHNMRTLQSQPANKQYKIAGETLYIYAPIANRLGLNKIKTELEDLSFRYEHPEVYETIQRELASTQEKREQLFANFTDPIKKELDEMGYKYEIKARVKSPYSIWCKMQSKHLPFSEIFDILAVRIIFEPKTEDSENIDCFNIYLRLTQLYKSHPERFRDWIAHPKANGYKALHVTLMSKQGKWIEVQIRSKEMNEVAEHGFAAHWKYKNGDEITEDEDELNEWLKTIKEILDDPQPDAMDFLDAIKLNLFSSEIFVFTPKGEIKTMPAGCTALDFAFQIHTFIGSHCIGAKVNHKLVPLSHKLQSGDQVEIITSKSQYVQSSWVNFVSTAKAKAKIMAILRRNGREIQKKGEEIFSEWLKSNKLEMTTSILDKMCEVYDMHKPDSFFLALGEGKIKLDDSTLALVNGKKKKSGKGRQKGWLKYLPFIGHDKKEELQAESTSQGYFIVGKDFNKKKPVYISESNINQYVFPRCCHPIPGDDILGYIDNRNRIEIHKRACPVAARLKASYGNRILDAKWDMHKLLNFEATIHIKGIDRKGMLLDLSRVLSQQLDIYIRRITISTDNGIFDGTIEIRVHDRDDVKVIMENIKKIDDLQEVLQIM
ncbi:MAG: RelA/SpoT family protein [Prevotella sp.]|nr:RelA/SpoT family protein [Prevotella sp.]MDY2703758.1 RelA/SpoT family protein [Prevotella sp.]